MDEIIHFVRFTILSHFNLRLKCYILESRNKKYDVDIFLTGYLISLHMLSRQAQRWQSENVLVLYVEWIVSVYKLMFQETQLAMIKGDLDHDLHFHLCFQTFFLPLYSLMASQDCFFLPFRAVVHPQSVDLWVLERPTPSLTSNPLLPLPCPCHLPYFSFIRYI